MKLYLLLLFFLPVLFLLLISPAICEECGALYVNISESGKVISYYNEFYVVQVSGTATFYNAYNSTLFDIFVPANLPYLTLFETQNTSFFQGSSFSFLQFAPFETKEISYEIRGVTPIDPMIDNKSVLTSAMFNLTPKMYAFIRTKIIKAPIEEITLNTTGVKSIKNRRLITAVIENPTDMTYNLSGIKIIKTGSENITAELKRWTYPEDGGFITLGVKEIWKKDIFDYNCTEGEVYWITLDIVFVVHSIISDINGIHHVLRFNQDELELINKTLNESELAGNPGSYLEHLLFMKKSYSKTYFVPDDIVDVDIRINNFAPIARAVNITDYIPYGFRVVTDDNANFSSNTTLYWNRVINPDSSLAIRYTLEYFDEDTLGLDFFEPAILKYINETFYSQRISFVRQYIPENKLFVQKKIQSSINNEYVVTLKVQNLGEGTINEIHIKEFLDVKSQFREITLSPIDKGIWSIPQLKKNEVWEVSYITDDNIALTTLPAVLGIQNSVVLKTLIFEQTVRNEWIRNAIPLIEKIGIGVIITIPLVLFILNRKNKLRKRRQNVRQKNTNSFNIQGNGFNEGKINNNDDQQGSSAQQRFQSVQSTSQSAQSVQSTYVDYQAPSSPYDEINRKEAHENIDELKKAHEQVGHKNDNI
jgi:hypothetical protein